MTNLIKNIKYFDGFEVQAAELEIITGKPCILKVRLKNGDEIESVGDDFFECFKSLRNSNKSIVYYCKGAKKNVLPSRMTRQMTMGLTAYETVLGQQARKEDLVDIFDFDDENIVSDPQEQDEYQKEWFASL